MGTKQFTTEGSSDDAALREIVEGVESETGDRFFYSLVKHLASALGCEYAFVSELLEDRLRVSNACGVGTRKIHGKLRNPPRWYPVRSSLERQVLSSSRTDLPALSRRTPASREWGVESYCGVPLLDSAGTVVGHLAILSERPMLDGPRGLATMRIFAARARAELERLRNA